MQELRLQKQHYNEKVKACIHKGKNQESKCLEKEILEIVDQIKTNLKPLPPPHLRMLWSCCKDYYSTLAARLHYLNN